MWQPFMIALSAAVLLGLVVVPLMKRLRFGQVIRSDGPSTHLYKSGIPTMGGIIFIIPIVAVTLIFSTDFPNTLINIATILLFALVGTADDLIKIRRKDHDGLSVLQKSVLLLLISASYSTYVVLWGNISSGVVVPFSAMTTFLAISPYIYIPFLTIFLYWVTNSANLTDGVDGLASSVSILIFILFFSIGRILGPDFNDLRIMLLASMGAVLGFLAFNAYPAKIFMGDTGSMAIGALVGIIAIQMRIPWIVFIAGIIFVLEALSVVIQVGYYKITQKRVFKMAPIHHHFELLGWKENKVVIVFCLVTAAGGALSYWLLGNF